MPDSPGRISAAARAACTSDCHTMPCLQLFQAVFGMTKKDLLDYIRAGSRGDLLNRRWWFQGRNSKDGQNLSEELEAEDRLEADKERAGSSTQVALAHLASLQPIHGFTAMLRFWQAGFFMQLCLLHHEHAACSTGQGLPPAKVCRQSSMHQSAAGR